VLQCGAVWCSVVQCGAGCYIICTSPHSSPQNDPSSCCAQIRARDCHACARRCQCAVFIYMHTCSCSVLQCVAVCCSVIQCGIHVYAHIFARVIATSFMPMSVCGVFIYAQSYIHCFLFVRAIVMSMPRQF